MNMTLLGENAATAGVSTEWGKANEEVTEIQTKFEIPAPNVFEGRLGNFGVGYEVDMNSIRMASAQRDDVFLNPDGTVVRLNAEMDNQRIPKWWKTHVNNDETSTIRIEPQLQLPVIFDGISASARAPTRKRKVETDVLGCVETEESQDKTVLGRTVFTVEGFQADWGEASAQETPVDVTAYVSNPNSFSIGASRVDCEVKMNGIKVGEGSAEGVSLPGNSEQEVNVDVTVENDELPSWWYTHVENGEESEIEVTLYAVYEVIGRELRIPIFSYDGRFDTDFLEDMG